MTTVKQLFDESRAASRPTLSFEIFPPKGDLDHRTAREVAGGLAPLGPDFISVTYSAGGCGNKHSTNDVAEIIQSDFDTVCVAHLTCAGATAFSIAASIEDLRAHNIENVLALRGDIPAGVEPTEFRFAKDLIPTLADAGFCVGAAAYPEGHIDCIDPKVNIDHLKEKVDAGASFLVTQLFFDNDYFYRFRERCTSARIYAPITCGIMPFLSKQQIQRMVFMCGASLPSPIIKLLARYEDDPASLRAAGIEYACKQLVDLEEHGADGLHVYTMNHPDIARACTEAIRCAD